MKTLATVLALTLVPLDTHEPRTGCRPFRRRR